MNNLYFLGLAGFLGLAIGTGCIVNSDDDGTTTDANASTGTTTDSPTTTDDPGTTTTDDPGTTTTDDPGTTTDEPGTTTNVDSSTGADESSSGEPPAGNCGWSDADGFYACGFMGGEDPSGTFPFACPEGLVEGQACEDSGLTGEGCCDAMGNNWYCTMEMVAFSEACE